MSTSCLPAYEILQGDYLLSSTQGLVPMQGVSKYFNTRLPDAILALTGIKFSKKFTSHDLRRTVATRLAESLGDEGDKLVRRVLGHSDGSVTAIYNRYGYVREMRRALEQWANDLTLTQAPVQLPAPAISRDRFYWSTRFSSLICCRWTVTVRCSTLMDLFQ